MSSSHHLHHHQPPPQQPSSLNSNVLRAKSSPRGSSQSRQLQPSGLREQVDLESDQEEDEQGDQENIDLADRDSRSRSGDSSSVPSAQSSTATTSNTTLTPTTSDRGRNRTKMGAVPTAVPPKDVGDIPEAAEEDERDFADQDSGHPHDNDDDTSNRSSGYQEVTSSSHQHQPEPSSSSSSSYRPLNAPAAPGTGKQRDHHPYLPSFAHATNPNTGGASTPRTPLAATTGNGAHLQIPGSATCPTSRSRQATGLGYGSIGSNSNSHMGSVNMNQGGNHPGGTRRSGSRVPSRSVSRARTGGFPMSNDGTGSSRGGTSDGSEDEDGMSARGDEEMDHHVGRSVSQVGHARRTGTVSSQQQHQQQAREKRDKGEELIRQRQIERRKAKRLASARVLSRSNTIGIVPGSQTYQGQGQYMDEETIPGEDVFVGSSAEGYQHIQGGPHTGGLNARYSVPSTPMLGLSSQKGGNRASGPGATPAPERNVSASGRKRMGTVDSASSGTGYFPPFGSIERSSAEWGRENAEESEGDVSTPLATGYGHHHHQQPYQQQQSQTYGKGSTSNRSSSRAPLGTGARTPRMGGMSTPGLPTGFRMESPLLTPGSHYGGAHGDDRDDVGKAASVIEQVVSELGSGEQRGDEMDDEGDDDDDDDEEVDEEGVTVRDRQDAINIEHPFGLPIWKPALYKKSRSITRNAEFALHSIPSAAAERHLLPGNLLWTIVFGWWLALMCFAIAGVILFGEIIGGLGWRGKRAGGYARTVAGLGWYIGWPFGKYVEGKGFKRKAEIQDDDDEEDAAGAEVEYGGHDADALAQDEEEAARPQRVSSESASSSSIRTVKGPRASNDGFRSRENSVTSVDAWKPSPAELATERDPLVPKTRIGQKGHVQHVDFAKGSNGQARDSLYGAIGGSIEEAKDRSRDRKFNSSPPHSYMARLIGGIFYWPLFILFIAPTLIVVCLLCWGMVLTIPMARLTWALLNHLARGPLDVKFRSAPKVAVPSTMAALSASAASPSSSPTLGSEDNDTTFTFKRARLRAGQLAPTPGPDSTVLLCIYRAIGWEYYKYTVGGVNIMFVNLLPLVFFTIFDGLVLLPMVERQHRPNPLLELLASQAFIFVLGLASVIPLSYFIGMAVASISAQSSIGMGAVINATFGSVIEIVLYSIALTQGKGKLVEGSIVGSFLAAVLLMPGGSMISAAFKRKEQKFNARSAGVTSTMLIMAVIGTLTPTLFYQTYGSFTLRCEGCPGVVGGRIVGDVPRDFAEVPASVFSFEVQNKNATSNPWQCDRCYYDHPEPATDPFYQDQVKGLMYFCATILLVSYLIGLWFSLRTHASQIWQNPQQLMKVDEIPVGNMHPAVRASMYQRLTPQAIMQQILPTARSADQTKREASQGSGDTARPRSPGFRSLPATARPGESAPAHTRKDSLVSQRSSVTPQNGTPMMGAGHAGTKEGNLSPMKLPNNLTPEDFTRAVAAATVNALRQHAHAAHRKVGPVTHGEQAVSDEEEHGGHEGPSWSRAVSAGVLLSCTVLYAAIAEILVDVVDVVLQGSGIDEKFLGITLFALVPNTTEFMNAFSFALNGNIALSMEIGSAYALQVCLLQIPAMVAFSAFYDPGRLGEMVDTFTLIFPRWDVIAIIFSIFLMTYTYIEARSNYHRGSILVLAYLVLTAGFYFAPSNGGGD